MISHFYLKAATTPFDFDLSPYNPKHLVRRSNMIFLAINDDVTIRESEDLIEIRIGYPSLSFATIRWFEKECRLEVDLDSFGLQSVFFYDAGDTVCLSNRINTLGPVLPKPEVNPRDLSFYLVSGFLPSGWTFWKHIHRVAQRSSWNLLERSSKHEDNESWVRDRSIGRYSSSEIIESLREGLEVIHREVRPLQLRMSGGADSRIVSSLWKYPIENVAVRSPWMADGSDQDVNLARAWSLSREIPFRELRPDAKNYALFGEPGTRPLLTGLCGGEFLGGQFERVIPSKPVSWDADLREYLSSDLRDLVASDPWYQAVTSNTRRWQNECARVFLQSARSTIYGSLVESWTVPCEIHFNAVSPFAAPPFLEKFLNDMGSWDDYGRFENVFRTLDSPVSKIPLSSQLTLRAKDLLAGPEWGREPKMARPKTLPRVFRKDEIERMASVLQGAGVELSYEGVERLLERSPFRLNTISLYNWIDVRFPR